MSLPSSLPYTIPTMQPVDAPSLKPTSMPSAFPSSQPSPQPSCKPSLNPSHRIDSDQVRVLVLNRAVTTAVHNTHWPTISPTNKSAYCKPFKSTLGAAYRAAITQAISTTNSKSHNATK